MINCHNLHRRFADVKDDYFDSLEQISKNEKTVCGPYTEKVENKLKEYSKREHVLLVRSGTQALTLTLLANNITLGDEVIISNYSCHASLSCVTVIGAVPVFCEVNEYGSMDPAYLNELVTNKTKALIATGLYGDVHDHEPIKKFCKKHNILYINDAAQSYFATYNGQDSLTLGDTVCISFAENKPIPSLGTFGAILTDDTNLYNKLLPMRKNGKTERLTPFVGIGVNGHPEEDKAAQILASTKHIKKWQARRLEIAEFYNQAFKKASIPVRPSPVYSKCNAHKYVIYPSDKFSMHEKLYAAGVNSECHYTENFNDLPWLGKTKKDFAITDFFVKKALSIPMNPYLTDNEVETVVAAVIKNYH
jgi:UDP-2-acetamido-2-deoxy-ribo-hexuluronate aminotransferase